MYQVTLLEIVNARDVFDKLISMPMPLRICSRITKLLRSLNKEYQVFEEVRSRAFKKFAELDENGVPAISEDAKEKFYSEVTNSLNMTVQIDLRKLDLGPVFDKLSEQINLTPKDFAKIEPFLQLPDEESDENSDELVL